MKKILVVSVLALSAVAISDQKASAWANFKFGVGLNLSYTSANNSLLWGLWNNGPAPGCCAPGGYGDCGPGGYDGYAAAAPAATGTVPASAQIQPVDYQSMGYGSGGYQPVSYYPGMNYGYYQAPSYWYGR